MTNEPQLYGARIGELTQLIEGHLERGSLDEGNANVFDSIIDAWLEEEIARLDGAVTAAAYAAATERAVAEAERQHRRDRELAADARRQKVIEALQSTRLAKAQAHQTRYDQRVRAAEERLEEARTALAAARSLLLGPPPPTPVVASYDDPEGPDDNEVGDGDERVA
ncbi:MAG TPA: hypothetical protein VF049_14090 [Nocardioidaceae bacterium]|jgi:hypothetical protein